MVRHNPSSMSEDGYLSVVEPMVTDPVEESEALSERLRAQLESSERLNEYYNAVVAELRASLELIEEGDQAS